jgi:hypothetical protein
MRLAKPPSGIGNGGDTFLARVDAADRGLSGWLNARAVAFILDSFGSADSHAT